jgi:hypothetical protein
MEELLPASSPLEFCRRSRHEVVANTYMYCWVRANAATASLAKEDGTTKNEYLTTCNH